MSTTGVTSIDFRTVIVTGICVGIGLIAFGLVGVGAGRLTGMVIVVGVPVSNLIGEVSPGLPRAADWVASNPGAHWTSDWDCWENFESRFERSVR